MFHICCCHHADYCMLFSDLWPVYITLIGKLMLRKVLISLWHQFIEHDMTCEVCDSKHLCSFHFIFQHCSFILTFQGLDFASKHQYVFRVKIAPLLKQVITRANSCFEPILIFMQLKNWFSPRSNHPLVQEKHLANSCVFSCGEQGGPIGIRLVGKDCKRLLTCFTLARRLNFLYLRKIGLDFTCTEKVCPLYVAFGAVTVHPSVRTLLLKKCYWLIDHQAVIVSIYRKVISLR